MTVSIKKLIPITSLLLLPFINNALAATTPPEVIGLIPLRGHVFTTSLNEVSNEVYAVNSDNKMLYIIDGKTDRIKETPIDLGGAVNGLAYNSKTDQIIVSYIINGTVAIIDRKTKSFIGQPITVGLHPAKVAVDESTNTAYVSNMHSGTVSVIDIASATVKDNIIIGTGAPTPAGCNPWDSQNPCTTMGSNPLDMKLNKKTHKLYVASYLEGTISVVNTLTNAVEGSRIAVGSQPNGMGINESTNRIYINNWQDGTVSVINGKTNKVIGEPIIVGSGLQNPLHCYEAGKLDACISWGSMPLGPIGVNEKDNLFYVASSNDGTLITLDGKTNTVIGKDIHITSGPLKPAGCANFGACTQGSSAQNVLYNAKTKKLYVVSLLDGWLMVLNAHAQAPCVPMPGMPEMCM